MEGTGRSLGRRPKEFGQSLLTLAMALVVVYPVGEALVFAMYRDRIALFPAT